MTELLTQMAGQAEMEGQPAEPAPAQPVRKSHGMVAVPENLQQAKACKEAGNALYNEEKIKPAIRKYHEALLHLKACQARCTMLEFGPKTTAGMDKPTQEEVDKVQAACLSNLAACLLKLPTCDYSRVVTYCNNALAIQPNNSKAVFRKGVAHYRMGNYSIARQYLKDAAKLCKGRDDLITKYLNLCAEAEASSAKK